MGIQQFIVDDASMMHRAGLYPLQALGERLDQLSPPFIFRISVCFNRSNTSGVRSEGLEPSTFGAEIRRSIRLNYERK